MKEWFSARELAGEPGMPKGRAAVRRMAEREEWRSQQVTGVGGTKTVYHLSALPLETQIYLNTQGVDMAPDGSLTLSPSPSPKGRGGQDDSLGGRVFSPADASWSAPTPAVPAHQADRGASARSVSSSARVRLDGSEPGRAVFSSDRGQRQMTPQSRSVSSLATTSPPASNLTPALSLERRGGKSGEGDGAIAAVVRVGIPAEEPEGMPRRERVAIARCAYIQAQLEYCAQREIAAVDCEYEFCQALKQGLVGVYEWVKRLQKAPSRSTLCRWKTDARRENLLGMAPQAAPKRGTIIDSNEFLRGFIVGCVCKWPHVKYRHIYRAIKARFPNAELTEPTVRRWVQRWKAEHHQQLALLTDPDGWKNRYLPAFGSYSEGVTAINDLWELDSTPADVMLADGRYAIVGCVDVYSRRAKLLVTKTSKASAIIALLRRCILDWGVPKTVKTDNGKDYTAFHIEHTLQALEIDHKLCVPFSPEQKPHIERFLGTFLHDFLELLPGYIGHSVADRKQIESRKSFAERFGDKPLAVDLDLKTFQVFCDSWCEGEYAAAVHGSTGKAPAEMVAGQSIRTIGDERVLDLLMTATATRTVQKKGIKIEGRWFIAPELAGQIGNAVHLRLPDDAGRVYVFADPSCAEFVCVAEDPDFTGASRQAIARKAAQWKNQQREAVRNLRKLIDAANLDEVPIEVLESGRQAAAAIEVLPGKAEPLQLAAATTQAVDEYMAVAQPGSVAELTAEERAANEAFRAELAADAPKPQPVDNPYDRYLFDYYAPRKEGRPVDDQTQAWVDGLDRPLRKQFDSYAEDLYVPNLRRAM